MEITSLSIKQLTAGIKKKEFSEEEIYRSYLQRIKKYNKELNIFLTVCDKPYKADKPSTAHLSGIPVGVKDIFVTKGLRTTAASKVLENYMPEYSATLVNRILENGASVIGKTNLDAWAHGASGENSDFGPTKNPWNIAYVPGGSSSGSAAAVAAGMCPAALATDTGGSIRLPASFCNAVGIKPSYGRCSRYGVIAMASSLDSPGVITKTAEDCELMFHLIAGRDEYDGTSVPFKARALPKKIRVGIPKEYFSEGIDPEVRRKVEEAIRRLADLPDVELAGEVSLPHTEYAVATYYIIVPSEISSNLARYDGIRYGHDRTQFGDEAKRRIMLGTYALSTGYYDAYYKKAMKVRTLIKQDFEKAFEKVDVLVAPVSPTPPFRLGEKVNDPLAMYMCDVLTGPVNLAGIPSLALPAGFTRSGLPIGMQLIGPQMGEEILFTLGKKYQEITDWQIRRPNL
ncbi:MAG TPA: Asp-tRNA(Asn)/Glu-tRNA(Gln) amidotransferase subunit GatA [Patescibacteria group bacterium]|nr:Asp-tRNA(Asn)/Glu-tRNA(Gln) amidotransferase subunit GatA [Patescibacteria group bacterium]